ncbi:MAG: hypothetical protein Q9167_007801, partial [Letrouitia subvulpina]
HAIALAAWCLRSGVLGGGLNPKVNWVRSDPSIDDRIADSLPLCRSSVRPQTPHAIENVPSTTVTGSIVNDAKAKWNDEEVEADAENEKPTKVGKERNVLGGLTKKRGQSLISTQPSPKRRVQRPRLSLLSPSSSSTTSSSSSSMDETEIEVGSDSNSFVPAKQDCASNSQTVSYSLYSGGLEIDSSKLVDQALKQCPASRKALSPRFESRNTAFEEQEWEVAKITGKRRAGKGYEYKVCWKDTWLPKNELENARRLAREFETRGRLQRSRRLCGPARTAKGL